MSKADYVYTLQPSNIPIKSGKSHSFSPGEEWIWREERDKKGQKGWTSTVHSERNRRKQQLRALTESSLNTCIHRESSTLQGHSQPLIYTLIRTRQLTLASVTMVRSDLEETWQEVLPAGSSRDACREISWHSRHTQETDQNQLSLHGKMQFWVALNPYSEKLKGSPAVK